jgi:hypothetical protein
MNNEYRQIIFLGRMKHKAKLSEVARKTGLSRNEVCRVMVETIDENTPFWQVLEKRFVEVKQVQ